MEALSIIVVISFITLYTEVEGKYCSSIAADGSSTYIRCSSYEYCCPRGCCRSPTLTFYQLWYFWLSVILILLLCSGGGWWYRFKYRNHIYTQSTGAPGPGTNAFYYPSSDRVFFQNPYKADFRFSQQHYPPPNMAYPTQIPPQHYHPGPPPPPPPGFRPAPFAGPTPGPPPPPPYMGPPPTYDSLHQGKG